MRDARRAHNLLLRRVFSHQQPDPVIHASLASTSGPAFELDKASSYRLVGRRIERGPQRELLAEELEGGWSFACEHDPALPAFDAITVYFENPQGESLGPVGPFRQLFVADGYAYGDDQLVAQLLPDERRWRAAEDGGIWDAMLLEYVRLS